MTKKVKKETTTEIRKDAASEMKPKKKLRKGTKLTIIAICGVLIGAGIYTGVRYNSYQSMVKNINIAFNEKNTFEYSNQRIDLHSMVSDYNGVLSIDPTVVDTNKIGTYTAKFTVTGTDNFGTKKSVSYNRFYTIEDTQEPVITLNVDSMTITAGDAFDPLSNIVSVKDIVDGDLSKADEKINGSYTVTSTVDANTAGSYKVTIEATDNHGKTSSKEYAVTVNAKPTSGGGSSYGGRSYYSGGGSSGSSSSGGSSSGGGDTCPIGSARSDPSYHWDSTNYATQSEAFNAGANYAAEHDVLFSYGSDYDMCTGEDLYYYWGWAYKN